MVPRIVGEGEFMRRVTLLMLIVLALPGGSAAAPARDERDSTNLRMKTSCGLPVRAFVMLFELPDGSVLRGPAIVRSKLARAGGVPTIAEVRSLVAHSCGVGADGPRLVWGAYTVRADTSWASVRMLDQDLFRLSLLPHGSRPVIRVAGAASVDTARFTDHKLDGSEISLSSVPMGRANLIVAVFAPRTIPRAPDYLERQRRFLDDVWAHRDSVNWLRLALN